MHRSLNSFVSLIVAGQMAGCAGRNAPATFPLPQLARPGLPTAAPSAIDWPTFGFNRQRWSDNHYEKTLTAMTVKGLKLKWSVSLGSTVSNTQPIVAANITLPNQKKTQVVVCG